MSDQPRTPKQKCEALIKKYGADLLEHDASLPFSVNVWTPAGTVWKATSCHSLTIVEATRPGGWKSLLEDLELGVEPCGQADCDTCEEVE